MKLSWSVGNPIIRYLTADDGVHIAWAAAGSGSPPLLALSAWASHLALDWTERYLGEFYRALGASRRLIRYDRPGVGMSDRFQVDLSLDRQLAYIDQVLDAARTGPVALLGRSMSGPMAIAYAATRPERVSHLVLFATGASLVATDAWPEGVEPVLADAVEKLILSEWGVASRTIADLMLPGVEPGEVSWFAEYQRTVCAPQVMAAIVRESAREDVTAYLEQVRAPTLVLHRRDDRVVRVESGERLAREICAARLEILEGQENLPYFGEPQAVVAAVDAFLNPPLAVLTERERTVLAQAARGLGNKQIARELGIGEATVARHLANVFGKLEVSSRTAAVRKAVRTGILPEVSQ